MSTAELIYQEAKGLPAYLGTEVLDFIGYLKNRHLLKKETIMNEEEKISELETIFAPHRCDLSDFHFNRDEANER
ncbi:DUF2281 domain-containing protein [Gammaproteobacteria bacterium]